MHLFFAHVLSPPDKAVRLQGPLALGRARLRVLANAARRAAAPRFTSPSSPMRSIPRVRPPLQRGSDRRRLHHARYAADRRSTTTSSGSARYRRSSPTKRISSSMCARSTRWSTRSRARTSPRSRPQVLSMFAMHRKLAAVFPFLYGPRFWRFSGRADTVLTLVPPHRTFGPVTQWMIEPIYCGAYHPGDQHRHLLSRPRVHDAELRHGAAPHRRGRADRAADCPDRGDGHPCPAQEGACGSRRLGPQGLMELLRGAVSGSGRIARRSLSPAVWSTPGCAGAETNCSPIQTAAAPTAKRAGCGEAEGADALGDAARREDQPDNRYRTRRSSSSMAGNSGRTWAKDRASWLTAGETGWARERSRLCATDGRGCAL